jgi:hypothetical protein
MHKFCFGLLCGVLVCSLVVVPAVTQQSEQVEVGGVPLQIGMAKDAVLSRIAAKGLNVTQQGEDETWAVDEKQDFVGTLKFTSSHLSLASLRWATSSDVEAAKVARKLYFVLKSFEAQSNASCAIEAKNTDNPEWNSTVVLIHCGRRTASLGVLAHKDGQPQTILDEWVK